MVALRTRKRVLEIGPTSNGILLTPQEFDRANFQRGWRYELVNGVLVVTPLPFSSETDPNEELGHWLRSYRDNHPNGHLLSATMPEQSVKVGRNRRRADRVIWIGLGQRPKRFEKPTVIVEFASKRRRDRDRDYQTKRREYLALGVREYWVIDRFTRTMTVFGKGRRQVVKDDQTYKTDLLPGFELPLGKLLTIADAWEGQEEDDEEVLE